MPLITTVLFDLDDSLLDTFQARVDALTEAFQAGGVVHITGEQVAVGLRGNQLRSIVDELKETAGSQFDLLGCYRQAYYRKGLVPPVFAGIRDLVASLQARGIKLGVVTQKERVYQLDGRDCGAVCELRSTGLADFFPITVGFEDVAKHKPDPEGIHKALRELGGTPEATLFVGDSPADIGAALAAGCVPCHAVWALPEAHRSLDGLTPQHVLEAPQQVESLLR